MKKFIFAGAILLTLGLLSSSVFSQTSRTYTVTNNTGMTITSFYVSSPDANTWSSNLYKGEKLISSETYNFIYPYDASNCHYDIRFYDANNKEYILRNVDLCTGTSISFILPTEDMKKDRMEK